MVVEASRVTNLVITGDNEYSLMTRLEAWRIIWQIIKVNPILGLGPANYYWFTPLYPILGYSVSFNSHNNYVDIIAQTGLLGLACFIWFALETGWLGWRLSLKMPGGSVWHDGIRHVGRLGLALRIQRGYRWNEGQYFSLDILGWVGHPGAYFPPLRKSRLA